jgi:hypothetical protein
MRVAVEFALSERKPAIVMLRGLEMSTGIRATISTSGIRADIEAVDRCWACPARGRAQRRALLAGSMPDRPA